MFSELMAGAICVWVNFLLERHPTGKSTKWSIVLLPFWKYALFNREDSTIACKIFETSLLSYHSPYAAVVILWNFLSSVN